MLMACWTLASLGMTRSSCIGDLHRPLRDIVGDKGLIPDESSKHPYLTDWRENYLGSALAVVRPATTEEVAAVVKLCAAEKVAIVPQGGNTGMSGGGTPHEDGREIVLSLTRMNRILDIDKIGYTMTVEAGVVLKTIQETAADNDRLFPLSLGAEGSCTIGGNLSTNAGGVQVLHYGNARNLVLGLEVVLPTGEIWNGLRALKKDNTGYDLRDLYLGAEGTLGIITKAMLKLWPKPKDHATSWSAVPSPQAAVELLSGAYAASEDNVTSCELMGRQGIDLVLQHIPGTADPLGEKHDWYVLMEWSSTRPHREGGNAERPAREDGGLSRRGDGEGPGARRRDRPERGAVAEPVGAAREPHRGLQEGRSLDQARHLRRREQDPAVRARRSCRHEQGPARLPAAGLRPCRRRQPALQLSGARRLGQGAGSRRTSRRSAARSTIW